jgi:hypothetical protein
MKPTDCVFTDWVCVITTKANVQTLSVQKDNLSAAWLTAALSALDAES